MTMPRSTPDPFDSVRDAFSDLGTSEKAAFVLEATFSTLGQALAETGRRAASFLDALDIDAWFTAPPPPSRTPAEPTPAEPPPMAATPADLKTTATRKRPESKKPPASSAGEPPRIPPADDES